MRRPDLLSLIRRYRMVPGIPRINFRGHFAGIMLPSVVGAGPPHHAWSVGSRVPISGIVLDLASAVSKTASVCTSSAASHAAHINKSAANWTVHILRRLPIIAGMWYPKCVG